jgi:hypothetical protein
MSDEQLNTAIDEVARQMTEGSPPAGDADFRRRVLARIESGDAPRARWRPLFVAVPLAAAVVIAVVVTRSRPAPVTAGPKGPAPQDTVRRPDPFGPGAAIVQADPIIPAAHAPRTATVGAAPFDSRIDSIAVAPLGIDPLTPDPIPIERLETIAPIVVAPLDINDSSRRIP